MPEPTYIIGILIVVTVLLLVNHFTKKHKEKKIKEAYENLKRGDKVVLANGMEAKIISKAEGTVEVELSGGNRARFKEWAVIEINGKKII